jgi:hypothetical protein
MPFYHDSLLTYHESVPLFNKNDLHNEYILVDKELPYGFKPKDSFWNKEKKEWINLKLNPSFLKA